MKTTLVISLFLLSYACVSAQVEPSTSEVSNSYNGLIKGKVTDTATPRPNNLADALVAITGDMLLVDEGKTGRTDQAGNYEIINLPTIGEYVVTTSKAGYDDSTEYVTVTAGGQSFHDVRLYKTDTPATHFWNMGPMRWVLILCLLLVITYAVRYSFKRTPK